MKTNALNLCVSLVVVVTNQIQVTLKQKQLNNIGMDVRPSSHHYGD